MNIRRFFANVAARLAGYDPKTASREVIRHINLTSLPPAIAPYADADRIRSIFDDAESGQTDDYFRLVGDMIQSDVDYIAALTQRTSAFIKTPFTFGMPKGASLELQANTEFLRRQLEENASFHEFLPHLPTGALWPLAAGKWAVKPGTRGNYWDFDKVVTVPWSLLDFSGGGQKPAGTLGIKRANEHGQASFAEVDFPELEKGQPVRGWIVHRGHALTGFPDSWGGPIRAGIMWWFFGLQVRQQWANYIERGTYFLEGQHEANDTAGRDALLTSFAEAQRIMAIAVTPETSLKVHQLANAGGGQMHRDFLKYSSDMAVKAILGTSMTVNASANGFGGNQGAVQADATGDVFQMDSVRAGRSILSQLCRPLLAINGRNPDILPSLTWGVQTEDQAALADTLEKLSRAGMRPTAAALPDVSERMGIPLEFTPAAGPAALQARTFAARPIIGPARQNLLSAAALAGAQIDRGAAALLPRAGRAQFSGLAAALEAADSPAAAQAACDDWLSVFNTAPLAGSLAACCAAHAANGTQSTAAASGLPA